MLPAADAQKMLDELGATSAEFSADLPDSYGSMQDTRILSEPDIPARGQV
jgi:hypothetical protein